MTAADKQTHVYRISIWRYLVMWWVLGPFLLLGLGLAIFSDENSRGAGIIVALIMAAFLLLWHWLVRRAWLEITPSGVRLHDSGGDLEATWQELIDLRTDPGYEGFITAWPMASKGAERIAASASVMAMDDQRNRELIGARRFISIQAFAFHLRRGDLRPVIARYAPHLKAALDAQDAPRAPKPPLAPEQRRRNWLIALIIAAAIAGSFVLIAQGERSQRWFFTLAYAVLNPLFALWFCFNGWQLLKKRNWLLGALMLLLALVMVGWSVQNWTQLQRLLHDAG